MANICKVEFCKTTKRAGVITDIGYQVMYDTGNTRYFSEFRFVPQTVYTYIQENGIEDIRQQYLKEYEQSQRTGK